MGLGAITSETEQDGRTFIVRAWQIETENPQTPTENPGDVLNADGSVTHADGSITMPDGTVVPAPVAA